MIVFYRLCLANVDLESKTFKVTVVTKTIRFILSIISIKLNTTNEVNCILFFFYFD